MNILINNMNILINNMNILINIIRKMYLLYFLNNMKYNLSNDILNIKYRQYFKKRALQRANAYMHNNQLYGNRKWN